MSANAMIVKLMQSISMRKHFENMRELVLSIAGMTVKQKHR